MAANRALYSENRFIVVDGPSSYPVAAWPPGDYPHKSFAASQFLRDVVPRRCLGHLRFLEVVFAPFNHLNKPRDGHPALEDWLETLDWAKHSLNLPVLTQRLVVATSAGSEPQGSREMRRAQGKEVLAVYNSIVYPLSGLGPTSDGGMARFYADLAWPKCGAGVTCNIEAFLASVINQDRAERQRIATDQPTHFLLNPTDLSSFFVCSCASSTLHSNKCSSPPAWFETNVAA